MELNFDFLEEWEQFIDNFEKSLEKDGNQRGEYIGFSTGYIDGMNNFAARLVQELENKLSEKSLDIVIDTINNLKP